MKKDLSVLIVCAFMACTGCQEKVDINKEKEAILTIIEDEKAAFFEADLDKITGTWKQDSYSRKIYIGSDYYNVIRGWPDLLEENIGNLREDRLDFSGVNLDYRDIELVAYENTVMVYLNVLATGVFNGENIHQKQNRIYHLVKDDDNWKIDLMLIYDVPEEPKDPIVSEE